MHDERAERLRQQELIRKAEAIEQTEAARWGFLHRFEREADPERVLGEEERRERGVALRREYMRKLAARSVRARRERELRLRMGEHDTVGGPALSRIATRTETTEGRRRGGGLERADRGLYGRWRITRMDLWDQRDVEYFGPAVIELDEEGTGTMAFEFVVASLDHRPAERGGHPAIEFSWDGGNGRKPATGRGWIAAAARGHVVGHFYVHKDVDSAFTAARIARGRP